MRHGIHIIPQDEGYCDKIRCFVTLYLKKKNSVNAMLDIAQ